MEIEGIVWWKTAENRRKSGAPRQRIKDRGRQEKCASVAKDRGWRVVKRSPIQCGLRVLARATGVDIHRGKSQTAIVLPEGLSGCKLPVFEQPNTPSRSTHPLPSSIPSFPPAFPVPEKDFQLP